MSVRVGDEEKRDSLLESQPPVVLPPHQQTATEVHEHKPEIAGWTELGSLVGADQESDHQSDFQPLTEARQSAEVVETVEKPERNADKREAVQPPR